jgi:ubiquinone/menaquinone biosynthesis C-methylase UbiE
VLRRGLGPTKVAFERWSQDLSLTSRLLSQVRSPTGWLGRWHLRSTNRRHSNLTDWGLEQVSIGNDATILDIGCGGGRTIHKLAAIAVNGRVYGIDYSATSVDASRKTNEDSIKAGRVEIRHGSVSQLPFDDEMFDLCVAVETHFYWPDLPADLREILRVLKPHGALVIVAEVYKGGKYDSLVQRFAKAMQRAGFSYANLTVDEHRDLFVQAGFSDVQVVEQYEKGWICGIGKKPSAVG